MKQFKYRLETVLDYKTQVLDNLKTEHAVIIQNVNRKQEEIQGLHRELTGMESEFDRTKEAGAPIENYRLFDMCIGRMEEMIDEEKARLKILRKQEEEKKQEVITAKVDTSKFEKLKDRKFKEYQKEGAGPQPKEEDIVTVDYSGRLIDGKVFTSPDGKVREEKFVMMTLIPALKEGLTMMKEGSSYTFVVPASLAYGEEGAGDIPPESALIFDVTLKKVEKPGANKDAAMPAGHPKMAWPHG